MVDDRADFAVLLEAGLHVGQDDLAPADSRRLLGPDAVLGFSSHNAEQLLAAAAEPVDYVALGPIFPTASKQNPDPVVGLDELARLRPLLEKPLVAIGGITRADALQVLAAGADSLAVIADLFPDPCTTKSLRERMEEWQTLVRK
jgi:thiamine-phosphate pyrophosphorylase